MNKTYHVVGTVPHFPWVYWLATFDQLWKASDLRKRIEQESFWGYYAGVLIIDATALTDANT